MNTCVYVCVCVAHLVVLTCVLVDGQGRFSNSSGEANCLPCAAGRFLNTTGGTTCLLCPLGTNAGSASMTGAVECVPCPAGTRGAAGGVCVACEPGKFSNASGQTQCVLCSAGYQNTLHSAVGCTPCPQVNLCHSPQHAECVGCE